MKIEENDEFWVHNGLTLAEEIIGKYGVKCFVDSLDREAIIALCAYFRQIQQENNLANSM